MGLDTTHDCWHGAYSTFNSFRIAVAACVGVDLYAMADYTANGIPWESLPPDPLHVLLRHSDCDGEIAVEDCIPLAERLEAIAKTLREREASVPEVFSSYVKAEQFARGLRLAAERGENVEFH